MKKASLMVLAAFMLCNASVICGEAEMTAREKALRAAGLSPAPKQAAPAKAPPGATAQGNMITVDFPVSGMM